MKKLLSILLIFITATCYSQGLKITGKTFTNNSDSLTITAIYVYPLLTNYNTFDSSFSICFPAFYRSAYAAKNQLLPTVSSLDIRAWGISINNYQGKSSIGIPTPAYLNSTVTTYLNSYGFTVTTF